MGLERLPKIFKQKVDTSKVQLPVIRKWITEEIDKYLKDDDIVAEYLAEMVEASHEPNIVEIHTQMVDFLGPEDATKVCCELWKMLLSAQQDKDGVPEELVEREKQRRREVAQTVESTRQRKEWRERRDNTRDKRGKGGSGKYQENDERVKDRGERRGLDDTGKDGVNVKHRRTNYNRSRSKSPHRG